MSKRLQAAAAAAPGAEGEHAEEARLVRDDIKTTVAIVHNTNANLSEEATGEPSRLVKDLFLEPSGAQNEGACRARRAAPSGAVAARPPPLPHRV